MKKLIMIICALILIFMGTLIINKKYEVKNNKETKNNPTIKEGNKPFFSKAGKIDEEEIKDKNKIVSSYEEYKKILDEYAIDYTLTNEDFIDYEYLSIIVENEFCDGIIDSVEDATINNGNINILVNYKGGCHLCAPTSELYFVRFNKNMLKKEYKVKIEMQQINNNNC